MEKKFKVSIEQTHEFTSEDINDLLCTAFYGNPNFYGGGKKVKGEFVGVSDEDASKIVDSYEVLTCGGIVIVYLIAEDDDEKERWELTLDMFLKGIARYCLENNENLSDLLDNHDACTADSIVQYALFDEIVYG